MPDPRLRPDEATRRPSDTTPTTGFVEPVGSHASVILVLCCGGLLASFLATALVPVAGSIGDQLGVSATSGAWALTSTFLAAAASTPIAGRAADLVGERRVLTALVLIMAAGSIISAVSDDLAPMVAGRTLQGCGAGVIPVGMSVIRRVLGPERMATGASTMSVAVGLGGGAGLPLAAWVIEDFGLSMLFWGAGCVALLLGVAFRVALAPDASRPRESFDAIGAVGVVVLLLCGLIPVAQGARWGWTSPPVLGLLGAGALTAVIWVPYELRRRWPLVDIRAARMPVIVVANLCSALVGVMYMLGTLTASHLLQTSAVPPFSGMGQSTLTAGVLLTPGGLSMLVSTPLAARLIRLTNVSATLMAAAVVAGTGFVLLLLWHAAAWQVSAAMTVVSAGVGMAMTATPVMISSSTAAGRMAAAQALNVVARFGGTAVASALVVAVLDAFGDGPVPGVPAESAYCALFTIGTALAVVICGLAACTRRWTGKGFITT
ncbi:MFS transporter [Gordonia sp. KTR9]|uniref:MFS transporter n=1 Tax=Gordonia sp. KTR9 TaxID=337191 RepID=UPI00027DD84A|nr:MFS transporter [Gordonia sp. KTR9]AFR47899.1 Permease, MFS superfamily [Gordonia sp. KTR9]